MALQSPRAAQTPNMTDLRPLKIGRQLGRATAGVIRDSLFADACIKDIYDTHVLGKKSTAMVIQTASSITKVWQSKFSECEG